MNISKWKLLYFCLALLDLIAVGTSLYVNHSLSIHFTNNVIVNELLAKHLSSMEQLQVLASDVNAPGNDIFESKDFKTEKSKHLVALKKYNELYVSVLEELNKSSAEVNFSNVLSLYKIIPEKMNEMTDEAELIFSYFSQNKKNLADKQMATMDRRYAALRQSLINCSQAIRGMQKEYLDRQKIEGEKLQQFEVVISVLIIVMIIGVLLYGSIMSKLVAKSQREIKIADEYKKAIDASAIVAITDTNGKITYANEKFTEISGYSRQELIDKDHRIINSGLHSKEFFKQLWIDISTEKIWRGEVRNKKKDGSFYWVDSTIVPIKDENNKIFQYMAIRYEITERKLLEENLIKAREVAETASRVKSSFLANMSHEIRTPLNGILGICALLANETLTTDGKRYVEIIKKSGDMLLTLINDILDFSKIEAKKLTLENVTFNLTDTINELVSLLYLKAKEKNLKINIEIDQKLPKSIDADVTRFRQVVTNLLGNAIKFTEKGSVTVKGSAVADGDDFCTLRFDIIDTGLGMSKAAQGALFKSFSQVDASTTRKFGGTGLGLAICKGICQAMGGDIWVESTEGKGSTFSFTIKAKMTDSKVTSISKESFAINEELAIKYPYKILVADDHPTNQLLARRFLEKLGYQPDVVENGLEVLKALNSKTYDVIFMDGHMPEMDGYETTQKILSQFGVEKSPWIIACTASASNEDRAKCLAAGMSDFLPKPYTIVMMAQALMRVQTSSSINKKKVG